MQFRVVSRVLVAVAVLVLALLVTAPAFGSSHRGSSRWLRADDGADRAVMYVPKSQSKVAFRVNVSCTFGIAENDVSYRTFRFTGSKTKTVIRIWDYVDGNFTGQRVTYARFSNFMKARGQSSADVKYTWRKTASGKRFRYAQAIILKYGAEG